MERLTGLDPMFVYSDMPETPLEVAYACILDPSTAPGGYSFDAVRAVLEARIPTIRALRRRLVSVPLGLDHPRWVDDPSFELANHLHRAALPAPGGADELTDLVAEVMGRPLTSEQPPWEMHLVERLAGGMIGLIAKVHHSVIDGVAGAAMLAGLLDVDRAGAPGPTGGAQPEHGASRSLAHLPSRARLLVDAVPGVVGTPARVACALGEVARTSMLLVARALDEAAGPVSIPLGAPETFGSRVRARRAVAFAELDLGAVRAVAERVGATVNDVLLAVCSGALRSHLASRRRGPERPLVAVIPVSVRSRDAASGNQLSAMFVPLANDRRSPQERLGAVMAASARCKEQEHAVGYGPLASRLSDAVPPALARPVVQLGVRSGVLRKVRAGNLTISNVAGPSAPLSFAGMELRSLYPLGPVVDGVALNVTAQSYRDRLFVGINACASAVPGVPGLARAMEQELALLSLRAAGRVAPTPTVAPGWSGAADGPRPRTARRRAVVAQQGVGPRRAGGADRGGRGLSRRQ